MGKRVKTTEPTTREDDDDNDVDDRFAATFEEDDDGGTDDEKNGNGSEKVAAVVKPKTLDAAALERVRKDHARRGVVFLGTIPPFMKPTKLRQLLNEYGEPSEKDLLPRPCKSDKVKTLHKSASFWI